MNHIKQQLEQMIAYANMEAQTACVHHLYYAHLEEIASRLSAIVEQMPSASAVPVAWMRYGSDGNPIDVLIGDEPMEFLHGRNAPLYTAPQVPDEPKLSDSQELNRLLTTKDPSWDAWKQTIPEKYWARYDLSAVKLGWSAAMELVLAAPPEPQVPDGMVNVPAEYARVAGKILSGEMSLMVNDKTTKIGRTLIAATKEEG